MKKIVFSLVACLATALVACSPSGPTGTPATDAQAVAQKLKEGDRQAAAQLLHDYDAYYGKLGTGKSDKFNLELLRAGVNLSVRDSLERGQ